MTNPYAPQPAEGSNPFAPQPAEGSNPYVPQPAEGSAPQPAEDSSRPSLPPGAGERFVIEPEEEIVSKIGTLVDGDYYYDLNGEKPIPLEAERIVVLTGAWIAIIVPCAFALFLFMPFVKMMRDGPASVINQDHPIAYSVMLGVDLLIVILLVALSVLVFWPCKNYIDKDGFRVTFCFRTMRSPWPRSRSGLYVQIRSRRGRPVKTSQAKVVRPDGSAISIPIALMDIDADEVEKSTVIQCSRIWDWAVAKGYTEETGEYIPLRRRGKDDVFRRRQEERYGLRAHVNDNQENLQ